MKKPLYALLVALVATGAAYGSSRGEPAGGLSAPQSAAIDRIGRNSVSEHFAPSVVLAVERDGRTVYWRASGYRDVESRLPALPATRYPIGSNTKQFTAAAILLLQEEGKLNVDDRVSKYFPDIPHAREVTLRQLLTMSSGYADYPELPNLTQIVREPAQSAAQVVALVNRQPLDFKPGTRWSYCNTGYMILQMVIERISGMPLHEFFRQRFFAPLGMHSTYLRLSKDTTPNVAGEYNSFALGPWERATYWDYTWFGAAGSIVSDVSDLEKWNAALDGGHVISRRSLDEMDAPGPAASTPGGAGYGMGIRLGRMPNGHRVIWHGGNTIGSATQDARFPDDHLSIIVFSNSGFYNKDGAVEAIYKIVVPQSPSTNGARTAPSLPQQADPKRTQDAKRWLDEAVAGRIKWVQLDVDLRTLLTPNHRAALRALSQYGPRTYTLGGIDRRLPTTTYAFLVDTPKKKFIYLYKWEDNGKVADITILPIMEFPNEAIATPSPQPIPVQP